MASYIQPTRGRGNWQLALCCAMPWSRLQMPSTFQLRMHWKRNAQDMEVPSVDAGQLDPARSGCINPSPSIRWTAALRYWKPMERQINDRAEKGGPISAIVLP